MKKKIGLSFLFLVMMFVVMLPIRSAAAGTTITAQPKAVTAADGTTAKFTVKAAGSGLTYRWQYQKPDTTEWIDCKAASGKTSTLSVSARADLQGYIYRCVLTDSKGRTAATNSVKLTVSPAITAQPKAMTAEDGATAKFTVKATGSGLTYQWQYQQPGTTKWVDCKASSAAKAALSVNARAELQGYLYRCVITDEKGRKSTTNTAALTVNVPPEITVQPKAKTAKAGTGVTFSVTAVGSDLTYQWQYLDPDTKKWTAENADSAKTNKLTIPAKLYRNGTKFRCVIKDANGNKFTSNTAKLTVKYDKETMKNTLLAERGTWSRIRIEDFGLTEADYYQNGIDRLAECVFPSASVFYSENDRDQIDYFLICHL